MHSTVKDLPRVAFWLVPRLEDREKLQAIIVALAARFSAPAFVPHVTVCSCWRTVQQRELAVLAGLADCCQPITMRMLGLACKDRLTQTLFVQLQKNAAITRLHEMILASLSLPAGNEFEPHMSLLYQNFSVAVRETLVRENHLNMQKVRFDELWAVAIPGQLESLDNFVNWQTLLTCRLDSSLLPATIDT